ncbi:MAG: tRNA epoxyqueuosine(34) reductase QueG [Acidobacteriia bacterium]|nr:tRNA epoxyqueuosine(34) reductase QueG [Terriglobia bacterium]
MRTEARRLGFFKLGVVAARPLPWRQHLDDWLAQGRQGEMAYLERQADKRRDPSLVLDDVRSILILGINYHAGVAIPEDPLMGKISRYAWGDDYHRLMTDRLSALLDFIQRQEPDARGIFYADTGPVMEKAWGAQSALGWMGKHSNLITREQGSWFFIGVILLDFELEFDAKGMDYCGKCTRCLGACPTSAIVAPYVVDARLCISYLTIELKGAIPRDLRPLIGNRIFGCDDCQEVCPWNRFAVSSPEQAFWPRPGSFLPELAPLAAVTTEEFDARFKNSPIRRAKRDGFVRNVVVALGNSLRPEAVPALVHALRDPSALVRGHAAWALGQTGIADAIAALEEARAAESDPGVLEEIALALNRPPVSAILPPAKAFQI